ncbi:hypothetical protein HYV70_00100 [Candidatus Uhrbacteria bacterium]|nr:hypothetical protein [Candidatus Uhrbacteria bacterium]
MRGPEYNVPVTTEPVSSVEHRYTTTEGRSIEKEHQPERYYLEVDERFWSLLEQRVGRAKNGERAHPLEVKIVFNSQDPRMVEAQHRMALHFGTKEQIVIGKFFLDTCEIHFNHPLKAIEDVVAELMTHELVHVVQEMTGKFPEMGQNQRIRKSQGVDTQSP